MKEQDLIKLICDYLTAKQIFHYRQNSGSFQTERGGFYKFASMTGVECKVGKND